LISRHLQPADESEYTKESKAKAAKAAEEAKKQKKLEREARNRALMAIKEDRMRHKQQKLKHQTKESEENIGTSSLDTSLKDTTLIQIRLSTGQAIRQKFSTSTKISDLFEWVSNENEPSKNFQLVLPFPRKVFGDDQMDMNLTDAGLLPNASLNVVKLDVPPIVTSQQPKKEKTTKRTLRTLSESDDDDDMLGNPSQVPPQIPVQPVIQNNITPNVPPYFPPQVPPPQIPVQPPNNATPNVPPYFPPQVPPQAPQQIPVQPMVPPNFLPGAQPLLPHQIPGHPAFRQRMGRFPPNFLGGVQPPPFSGGGHRLTDAPIISQSDSDEEHG
jgi:hypothetical protein